MVKLNFRIRFVLNINECPNVYDRQCILMVKYSESVRFFYRIQEFEILSWKTYQTKR